MRLNQELLKQHCLINGRWEQSDSGATSVVRNKTTGQVLGTVPDMGKSETRRAISAAAQALPQWRTRPAKERAKILRAWSDALLAHADDLARLMTAEQGKPIAEARAEIVYAAAFLEWFGEEAKRLYGDIIPSPHFGSRLLVVREPVGVVAAITPWNFPAAMITRKVGPALAAGCTVVCKPAPQTPFSALALAELGIRAGVPDGVFNVVTGYADVIGAELTSNSSVRKVTFTGSTHVGKKLMKQCADSLKRISLELGGNAPFIVFADADLDAAVEGAITSKFRNSGQTCVCTNRFLVEATVSAAFTEKLKSAVGRLQVGDGMDPLIDQGPLIDESAVLKIERYITDAVTSGARILSGGKRHSMGGTFFEPTVLVNATAEMLIAREEIFGPVAAVYQFGTEAEAIEMANDTEAGLAAYVYTRDLARSWRMSEALEYGIVGLNTGSISTEVAPFGGVKASGIGREGSKYGILDYTELKYICVGNIALG